MPDRAAATAASAGPEAAGSADDDVLAALDRGDVRGAVGLLMSRYGAGVYRYCRQMVGDDVLADDVQQQVFVQAFRDLARFERRSSLRTWLFGIARHRALDAIKIEGRRGRRFPLDEQPGVEDEAADASALEKISQAEMVRALERCLEELAPAAKSAVLLRFREEFRYEEMAIMAGEKPGTLQARVARALPVLRKCIERRLTDEAV
ncbi:MAG TPA: RNA polymerase sigma factor [Kofleriaceae bacterium]|nr:RNA polymerase sigma factor [Kofleriaceae bacterium]